MLAHRDVIRALFAVFVLGMLAMQVVVTTPTHAQACPTPVALIINQDGYVLAGAPNVLRSGPSIGDTVIGTLPSNTRFRVLSGPRCQGGYNWWEVQAYEAPARRGWTADGDFNGNWVAPLTTPSCYNSPASRLIAGGSARVLPGEPNSLRELPGEGRRLGLIPAGGVMEIYRGPLCDSVGRIWWHVNYAGIVGWTAEGEGNVYWLEPFHHAPTPPPPTSNCALSPRLRSGATGQVSPGQPNALRDRPGLNQSGSTVIGQLVEGAIFTVLGGPECRDGYVWWYVTAGGRTGWTAEGEAGVYWVHPVVCANGMISQIAPGMNARVTYGLPNRLRTAPSTEQGRIIGQIPVGSHAYVLSAFQCDAQGRMWWLVMYNLLIGWTVEGENGVYWLTPMS